LEVSKVATTAYESPTGICNEDSIPFMRCSGWHHNLIMERYQYFGVRDAKVSCLVKRAGLGTNLAFSAPRFYCWGPSKPPMEMSSNEHSDWHAHLQTPVLFNHHAPVEINSSTISNIDLNPIISTKTGAKNEERVLILTPLRDAAPYISKHFDLLSELSYPHELIDLAFLVGDSSDDTLANLAFELDRVQKRKDSVPFRSAVVVQKDFGVTVGQDVENRHSFGAQGPRRKAMGRARNYLLATALKPDHSWVYWRDVDIVDSPKKILEDFMEHNKDVIVPSMSALLYSCFYLLTLDRHLVPPIQGWS
jgi:hypothetical protein